jgi:peptidoglycan/LPS O-acetylase OafA/YrhL
MSKNPDYLLDFIRTPYFLIIGTAFYAVDVFFWLSGFFLAFVILDPATKKYLKKPLTFAFAIFHRYCRIIPAYLVAIVIYWKVIVLTGSGPLWPNFVDRTADCEYMWRNILFVENLFSMWGDMHYCFGWGWYLSNDFQLFVISLFLIFIYAQNPNFGKILIWLTIAGTSAVGTWVCYTNGFKLFPYVMTGYSVTGFMNDYYYKPWCRAPPYLYGLFLGILYKEFINRNKECEANKELKNNTFFATLKKIMLKNTIFRYSFYVVGLFLVLFFSFFPRQIELNSEAWSQGVIVFWLGFQRLFFVIGLSFVFLNSLIISKDLIAKILSWKPFGFVANLNFCGYLVHYFIIERSFLGSRQTLYYDAESVLYMYFTDIFFTLVIASALTVFVELPFINLEKFIKGDRRKPPVAAVAGPVKEGVLVDETKPKQVLKE